MFREALLSFIKDSETSIKQLVSFYDRKEESEKAKFELGEYDKFLQRVIREIKSFVELMHDAVVRFYKLDVKTSMDVNQCECLTNLLTSIVLKNPVYSQVHSVFQFFHRTTHVKEAMRVINAVRKRESLPLDLGVDEVKLGKGVY